MNMIPRPTGQYTRAQDGAVYQIYSDGSYRRYPKRIRGKARVKAAKRLRRH